MGLFGNLLGTIAGGLGSKFIPIKGIDGGEVGGSLGSLLPFKKGGRVKKTGPIYAHAGEFVLPKGVPPTKAQKAKVAKGKKTGGKKGGKGGRGKK